MHYSPCPGSRKGCRGRGVENEEQKHSPTVQYKLRKLANEGRNKQGLVFDPRPLVQAAREQWADRPDLISALTRCTRQWAESELYTYFHDPALHSSGTQQWLHAGGRWLQCAVHGELLVDFRTHRRDPHRFEIAGIEFMDVVMGRRITDSHLRVVHIKQD